MNKYGIRLHGTSIESLWNKYSVIFQYFMCHYSHNMIGLLPFKRSKSLVYETWKCLTTGEFMQNGASRPLLVLLYFGLNFLRSQFAFTWHFTFISRVQDGCSSSIIFKSILLLWWTFMLWYQNPSPADVNPMATSWTVRQEEIRMLPHVACVFNLCAIFSPLPQVHSMVSVASWR